MTFTEELFEGLRLRFIEVSEIDPGGSSHSRDFIFFVGFDHGLVS